MSISDSDVASVSRRFQQFMNRLPLNSTAAIAVFLVGGLLGSYLLMSSHAATPTAVFEAESGTISANATSIADATASGNGAVQFGAASATQTTNCSPSPHLCGFPDATNTGYAHTGVTLHTCSTTLTPGTTYDSCQFNGDVVVSGACAGGTSAINITRSKINGGVYVFGPGGYEYNPSNLAPNAGCSASAVVVSDTTIDCGCKSTGDNAPSAASGVNFTLERVDLSDSGHGLTPAENVVLEDSYVHNLGGNTVGHKDGIYVGAGDHMTFKHNNIECNDGSMAGCTSSIGLQDDFGPITYVTVDHNLFNTIGVVCITGSGGPSKAYSNNHLTVTNNHFGDKWYPQCGAGGPVQYFDVNAAGNVWSGNVFDATGANAPAAY